MAIDLINYAFIRGKWYSFSDTPTAQQAIQKYNGNVDSVRTRKPVNVLVDETLLNIDISQWPNVIADAVGVTGDALINPPVNPIIGPVTEEVAQTPAGTTSAGPPAPSGPSGDEVVEEVDPWANLDQGKLNLAKRYADAGMLGRASTAFKDAGGTWDRTTGDRLRTEAGETSRYGGDFDFSKYGIKQRDFGAISDMAKRGKFGQIKNMVKKGGGAWDKDLHRKLAAEYQGKGGTQRDEVPTPQIYKTGSGDWRAQFQGTKADIAGKFEKGTPERKAAKDWRQERMASIKTRFKDDPEKFKARRKAISGRHKIMIGK